AQDDELTSVAPLLELVPDWKSFLQLSDSREVEILHRHERTGRPLGADGFLKKLENRLKRSLRPQKPGPKKKTGDN
ncbi:MAG: transposase, partial [Desulfocapsaceae bacterium]|nr:transposase [Desulfocapsaceae bacterium]